ncbi:MFS transporter [Neobacillus sp. OS1-2]|uniref:MFS transporter n=1 Tax=Neobacillus sp. OS1-2 TaxID=3070680 RepID=UPI0027DEC7BA|nr:MFS transporter [Neobacillus sp. OS1-2]WML41791.1 MFS transporter [Neobacillus sp. OS1-2]
MSNKSSSSTWAITLFCIGVFMAALDNGIISAALTTINSSFDVSANWGAWGVTIYTLGLAISIPIVGKISDRYGRKKLFIVEVALFGLGSLLVALSPSFGFYLSARFIQAMGGGGIFIIGSSHVLSTFPSEKQGKALGMLGAMNGVGAILGPNLGSFILDITDNWHFLFLINVPIAVILIILGSFKIQETKEPSVGKLDLIGTILLSLAVLSIMYGLTNIEGTSLLDSLATPDVYGFLLAGIALFTGLILFNRNLEKRDGDPILPVSLLVRPTYLLTLLIGALSGALLAGMIYIPSFSEQVLGIAAEYSGYWMTPLALASGIGAAFGGILVDKKGPILAVFLSGLITAIGFVLFPTWIDLKWQFIISSCIAGLGMGILLGAPLNILATERLEKDKGTALAGLSLSRQIGMTIAPSIYAGFIVRGFNQLPSLFQSDFSKILQQKMEKADISPEAMQEFQQVVSNMPTTGASSSADYSKILEHIQDPTLKEVIQSSVDQITLMAAQDGYGGLFYSTVVIAVLVVLLAIILKPIRSRGLQQKV